MLVSCRYCNRLHNRGENCNNKPKDRRKKEETYISRFRSSRLWRNKRDEIKTRDKFLCQLCLKNGLYTFKNLEVHHITPISKEWNKRLENGNLITLCHTCHSMVEGENKYKNMLLEMAEKNVYTFWGVYKPARAFLYA